MANRYSQILEKIFFAHHTPGATSFTFVRGEIESAAAAMGVKLPKNLGDVLYSFRFRTPLPPSIMKTAPQGKAWVIKLAGKGNYRFALEEQWAISPSSGLLRIKVPNATPGIIARYALDDEQALLAIVRYNRLVDIFTSVTSYSLQSHLRTSVEDLGQIEVDELYVGIDRGGVHHVFPLQAKAGRDRMSSVQIEQDAAFCAARFPNLVCRPLGAQFLGDGAIALFEFVATPEGLRLAAEKHYVLVAKGDLTDDDLAAYLSANRAQPS